MYLGRAFRAQEQLRQETQNQAQEQREVAVTRRPIVRSQAQGQPHGQIEDPAHVEQQTVLAPSERLNLLGIGRKALALVRNMMSALSRGITCMPSDTVATIVDLNFKHETSYVREDGVAGSPRTVATTRVPFTGITLWYTASQSP